MPYNKKSNKQGKKRATKVPLPLTAVPINGRRVVMTWVNNFSFTETAASYGNYLTLRLTSIYDAHLSYLTTSPIYFNELALLFQGARVHRTRLRFEGVGNASAGSAMSIYFVPAQTSTMPSDLKVWQVQPHAVTKTIGTAASGTDSHFRLDETVVPWEFLKVRKATYLNDMDYAGSFTNNPGKNVYGFFGFHTIGSGSAGTLNGTMTLSFEVELFNPVNVAS